MTMIKSFMSSASEENYNRIFRKKEIDKMDEIAENITAMANQQAEQEESNLTNEC